MKKAYILLGFAALAVVLNCTVKAQASENELPIVEKVESISGTKSDLYYCNATDTYLIYSKKHGWVELTQSESGTNND